jgi:hypothetical protein
MIYQPPDPDNPNALHNRLAESAQQNGAAFASPLLMRLADLLYISSAKRIARPTSVILAGGKDVIRAPIFPFGTVCK